MWGELEAPSLPAWPSLARTQRPQVLPAFPRVPPLPSGSQSGPYLLSATRFSNASPPTISLSGFRQICTM